MNPPIEFEHIDEYTLALYADEALPPEEMASAAAHLASCPSCTSEVTEIQRGMERSGREPAGFGPGAHMPEVWLSRYADGESPADEAALVKAHIATCERCRNEVEETRWFSGELKRAVARRSQRPADPTRGLVTVAMLQERPRYPKGEGDPDILRMMREVLERDDPEPPQVAPDVTAGAQDAGDNILRPKRPWWTAPVVTLAVAAALAVVALAPLCRGFPGLRACLGERLGGVGLVQVARFLLTPTAAPSTATAATLVARGGPPPTLSPRPPTRTPTPERTRNTQNTLPTLRAAATRGTAVDHATPGPSATELPPAQATYIAAARMTETITMSGNDERGSDPGTLLPGGKQGPYVRALPARPPAVMLEPESGGGYRPPIVLPYLSNGDVRPGAPTSDSE